MGTHDLSTALKNVLSDRQLLTHPFYRRWEAGELEDGELAAYAAQYRYFEAALPAVLETIAGHLPAGSARDLVEMNLADERSVPRTHLELFDDFADAVGALPAGPSPSTEHLLAVYATALAEGPAAALGAVAAYESQASAVAASKADGLRAHYGLPAAGTAFWELHADADEAHAAWTYDALVELAGDDPTAVLHAVRRTADAWWSFLDEREAERHAA